MGGAIIQWLRDEMGMLTDAQDSEYFANKVKNNGGIYVVPAFVGLGAPYWDMYARGSIFGLTRGSNKNHIIRAALESIAYQVKDLINAMEEDAGCKINTLKVDGGASKNKLLMQFQADITNIEVCKPIMTETTALGAAYLAGLAVGYFSNLEEIAENSYVGEKYEPNMEPENRENLYNGWKKAVSRAQYWEE